MSIEPSPEHASPASASTNQPTARKRAYVVGATIGALGLVVALAGVAGFASANSAWPLLSNLKSQATTWTVTAWLMIVGLIAVLVGIMLVIAALRPKLTMLRQAPVACITLALLFFPTSRWISNSVYTWVDAATGHRFSAEVWEVAATPDRLPGQLALAGVLLFLTGAAWLLVRAIRLGSRKVAAAEPTRT